MIDQASEYRLIDSDSSTSDVDEKDFPYSQQQHVSPYAKRLRYLLRLSITLTLISWCFSLAFLVLLIRANTWGWNRFSQTKLFPAQLTYSPAQDVIEYEVRSFNQADLDDLDPAFRQPPGPELDAAWSDLYNFGISHIDKKTATYLTNKTSAIPAAPDQYVVELDVFHQLHCLNRLRKALDPYYFCPAHNLSCPYEPHSSLDIVSQSTADIALHLNHCLHSLRQSLECHADVSTVVWQKGRHPGPDGTKGQGAEFNMAHGDVAHTCRNFQKVKDWAMERRVKVKFDPEVVPVEDGIEIPVLLG